MMPSFDRGQGQADDRTGPPNKPDRQPNRIPDRNSFADGTGPPTGPVRSRDWIADGGARLLKARNGNG